MPAPPDLVRGRFEAALPQVAELLRGALRAEEDDLVFFFVVVARDEVGLPAASLRIGRTPAFAADKPGGKHGNDDAAARRRSKVTGQDMAVGERRSTDVRTSVRDESGFRLGPVPARL